MAALAGVSVEYVTRLEQGRDRRPSAPILAALAGALRLTPTERSYLYRLAKAADPGFNCRGEAGPAYSVRPPVRALLDRLEPAPAVLVNRLGDVLAHTAAYRWLTGPIGLFDASRPNLARFLFTDARARAAYPDWPSVADEQVAQLKHGPFRADPAMAALADELAVTAGEAFTGRVATIPGLARSNGVVRLVHPAAGVLRLAYETHASGSDGVDQRLIVYLAADPATSSALEKWLSPVAAVD